MIVSNWRSYAQRTGAALMVSSIACAAIAQDTTISFRFNDPQADGVVAAIAEYEQLNPEIEIDFQRLTWGEARQQYLREFAVGGGPDVVHIAFVWPKGLGRAGALLPLNDLIESKGLHAGIEDFVAHDLALDEGTQYAVPWTTDTWSMIYRTDILAEAGIT
ncbi:MAG: extracellular solute-binding protein, partial [Rhodobacteraceae bacterium]|nr:extracellular solute-binding protein [Paracoccaceae bacterium]